VKSEILACVAAIAAMAACASADEAASPVYGKWRITRVVAAPWAGEDGVLGDISYLGKTVTFREKRVNGPGPIGCGGAAYEATDYPPQGLFQGALPEPVDAAMSAIGLSGPSVKGISVNCDTGLFEFHWADSETILLGLDNRVLTLSRTTGTRAAASTPEGVVQRFLEAHFAGDMSFLPETLESSRAKFTSGLNSKIAAYFAKERDPEEVPPIDGDPFTDSQDYPARFVVHADDKAKEGVSVPVVVSDAFSSKTVDYELRREKRHWLIDDLVFEDGSRLSTLLSD